MESSKTRKRNISVGTSANDAAFTFVWDFKKFPMDLYSFGSKIRSPEFSTQPFSPSKYCLDFYPCGKTLEQKDKYASLYLIQSKGVEKAKNIRFSCSLAKSGGSTKSPTLKSRSQTTLIPRQNAAWVHPCRAFFDSNFTLEVDIFFEDSDADVSVDEHLYQLSQDLQKAYEERLLWDMSMVVDGKLHKLHKAVIEARFPQIRNASGLQGQEFEKLLVYLYSGKLDRADIPIRFYDILSRYKNCKMQSVLFANARKVKAETCFTAKNISFTWIIRTLNGLKSGEGLSNFYLADESAPWTWFQVSFTVDSSSENLMISIRRHSELCKFIVCSLKIAENRKTFRHAFGSEDLWNIPSFVSKETLLQLPDNEIAINFEISVLDGLCASDVTKTYYHPWINGDSQFSNDLIQLKADVEKLLLESKVSDLKLIVDSEVLQVHKFILCVRSPVFRQMIEKNMASDERPEIVIENVDASVLKLMLRYIYCADVEIKSVELALRLYCAANTYQIPGLKKLCASNLKSSLTPTNAVRILLFADDYSDKDLVKQVMVFICSNSVPVINCRMWDEVKKREKLVKSMLEVSLTHLVEKKQ